MNHPKDTFNVVRGNPYSIKLKYSDDECEVTFDV